MDVITITVTIPDREAIGKDKLVAIQSDLVYLSQVYMVSKQVEALVESETSTP